MSKKLNYIDYVKKSFIQYTITIFSVVVVLIIGFFVFHFYLTNINQNYKDNELVSSIFLKEYNYYLDAIESLSNDTTIINIQDNVGNKRKASEKLYRFINDSQFDGFYVLMDDKQNIIVSNLNKDNQSIFLKSLFLKRIMSRIDNKSVISSHVNDSVFSYNQACIYSFAKSIVDTGNNLKGYLFLLMKKSEINDFIKPLQEDFIITDNYDNIIYSSIDLPEDPGDKRPASKLEIDLQDKKISLVDNNRVYVREIKHNKQGINVFSLSSLERSIQMIRMAIIFLIIMVLVVITLSYLMARLYSKLNQKGVDELIRDLEIKNLEEQFNPHFVFNVMESVRYQIGEDPSKAQGMLLAFSTLMRYSANHGQKKVTLETDIDYLNDFLMLQKIRYNNALSFEFDIPDELLDCLIPKLFLQPIVENSIKHGYVRGKILKIRISVRQENDKLIFTVVDNGVGIDNERLKEINDSLNKELSEDIIQHVGLYNIENVIKKLYGDQYGLTIDSNTKEGTMVRITIPYEVEDDV